MIQFLIYRWGSYDLRSTKSLFSELKIVYYAEMFMIS